MRDSRSFMACAVVLILGGAGSAWADDADRPLSLIVMDPLAGPLSCPCVEGYAQRKYEVLAKHLETSLGRTVKLEFAESLEIALQKTKGRADLVIGKDSVVRADAKAAEKKLTPLAHLTDLKGSTTQHGLIVVNREDPATTVSDLSGYSIIFGPAEANEKHAAAMKLLKDAGVNIPETLTIDAACSDGACKVIDLGPKSKTAAVISSYARPLLEGCGTIKKGDLRVVGQTHPVPFITAFASTEFSIAGREKLRGVLESIAKSPEILEALESLVGFLPATPAKERVSTEWPGWRGLNRDGCVSALPTTLEAQPDILWELPLARSGLGGIAATKQFLVFGDRDIDDFHDVFRCVDANTGEQIWQVERLAIGSLDYGNSPRTTPLISQERVYCLGAHGDLLCLNLRDGEVIWETNLREQFGSPGELPWGYCGSPILAGENLIVNPGAPDASLVALNAHTGNVVWKCPGAEPSYGSLQLATIAGQQQIIGHDKVSLGGWDPESGKRLWTIKPAVDAGFNVPTPVMHNDHLLVTTENNGARLFRFRNDDDNAASRPEIVATNAKLRPDMSTGVAVNDRFYCVNQFLYCLDLNDGLRELWRIRDTALAGYGTIIASDDRILVVGKGTLLLLNADGANEIVARQQVFDDNLPVYSHPAIVGNRMYIRGETRLLALNL